MDAHAHTHADVTRAVRMYTAQAQAYTQVHMHMYICTCTYARPHAIGSLEVIVQRMYLPSNGHVGPRAGEHEDTFRAQGW